jgi:hypothetical protein
VLESSSKIGSNVALGYMALVSNTDVYQSMLEAGATKKEAAAVALGSTLGMFAVDKFTNLGELFFDDLTSETEHSIRRTLIKEAKVWWEETGKQAKNKSTKNFIKKGIEFGKKQASNFVEDLKYHSTGFFGKAVGEGLEEMSEELVADIFKQLYELAGDLGFDTTTEDVGAFKDWHKRYATSFVGGALGGGLFYGVNLYNKGSFNVDRT